MAQESTTVSIENITGGVGIGVANAPVTTTIHLPPERRETLPSPSSTVPLVRDPDYIDRPTLRDEISTKLSAPGARAALVGLGGAGKTQLAVEYVRRVREQSPQTWVLWLHAGTAARLEQSVRDNADAMKIYGRRDPKADIFQLFHDWLSDVNKGRWLIVLDNVDDASFLLARPVSAEDGRQRRRLIDYLPPSEHGSVLVTSRSKSEAQRVVHGTQTIEVPPMAKTDAKALLEKKLGAKAGLGHEELAAALDHLPLAMAQAAAYIRQRQPRCSVEQYLDELERSSRSRTSLLWRDKQFPDREHYAASSSILVTWQISFEHIAGTRPSAADLLSVMSFCDRQAIPESLVRDGRSTSDRDDSSQAVDGFEDDVAMLRSFSFISATADRASWEMHRLVQDATRMWLAGRSRYEEFQDRFLSRLNQALPSGRYENWTRCQVLFPHAQVAAGYKPSRREALSDWATVMYNAAWYAQTKGQWTAAEAMAVASMQARTSALGEKDERAIESAAMLGSIWGDQGRWKEAEQQEVKVMEMRQATLGADHPDTLTSEANLASTYRDQGRWKEAEQLNMKVMKMRQATLGADHPSTLTSMGNLARTYSDQGRWKEAEQLEVKVMEMRQATLGADHPDTLTSIGNLARTYSDQGRWKEAEQLEVKVMEMKQATLGADHPSTLTSMNNLARTYSDQGRWKEAEQLEVKVMEMKQATLGADHPSTLTSMNNLAGTYSNQGRWKEAEQLQVKVMEMSQATLGADHPDTLTSMANLASTYYYQGRWKEAEQLQGQAVEGVIRRLGKDHPYTISATAVLEKMRHVQDSKKWWHKLEQLLLQCMYKVASL